VAPPSALLLLASACWAALGLTLQARAALTGRRGPFAPAAGSAARGVIYSFTGAMSPRRKESVSRHPLSFAAGVLLHAAVFGAFATALASAAAPRWAPQPWAAAVLALGLAACVALFVKRVVRRELRAISVPEDFTANAAVALLLGVALAFQLDAVGVAAVQVAAAGILFYLPLGKLRHGMFFFLARADLGRKLGRRGVYPPGGAELRHD